GLPARDASSPPQPEPGLEDVPNPIPLKQNPKFRTPSPARDNRQARNESQAESVKVSDPPDLSDPVTPYGVPKTITLPGPIAAIPVPSRHDLDNESGAPPVPQR